MSNELQLWIQLVMKMWFEFSQVFICVLHDILNVAHLERNIMIRVKHNHNNSFENPHGVLSSENLEMFYLVVNCDQIILIYFSTHFDPGM